jgi:GntR family transcriptional repressor for pyruvate dehydrogenase complex
MKAVKKMPVIDQVVENIKESITGGELSIGAKLPSELSLCGTLSVGRSTIREALRVLQTLGYVELKPGRGAFVRDTDPHDKETVRRWFKESAPKLEDVIEVRKSLELLAVKKAVENCTQAGIKELFTIQNSFVRAVDAFNVSDMSQLDEDFHKQIFSMSKNTLLMNLYNIVAVELKKYRVMSFSIKENGLNAIKPHRKIAEAIRNRDTTDAVSQMGKHLKLVISDMEKIINNGS